MKALIGKKAPEFHAPAVVNGNEIIEDFSLEQYVGKKYVVMFFYPNKGGIHGVTYPLVSDFSKTISENFGVLAADYITNESGELISRGNPVAYRGLFLIDKEGLIRHYVINDLPLGRNVDEALRMVDALQHFEEYGEVCPANWSKGKDAMKATNAGVSNYLSHH